MEASQDTRPLRVLGAAITVPALPMSGFHWLVGRQRLVSAIALIASGAAIFIANAPVLGHYFFGDDFVALRDIASRSTPAYLRDLFLLRDLTPNWRFLAGLFYLGAFRAFGLNAFPFLLISLLVHIGTAGLVFALVRRVTGETWPAFLAATLFGLSAAHAPTVAQVTAFNNVLAGFLVMLAVVTLYEGLERNRLLTWGAASAISFAGAIAANEATAVLAPVFVLLVLWKRRAPEHWWQQPREWAKTALVATPHAAIGAAAVAALGACRCTEAPNVLAAGEHIVGNFWIYLGRLLYPVGLEFPGRVGDAHLAAGIVVSVLVLAALLLGPPLARISAAFLLLALIPYLPIQFALASRYVYVAAIPFSILASLLFVEVARYGRRFTPLVPAILVALALSALGLHAWQTWDQNQFIADGSSQWRTLVAGLETTHPDLPEGSRVFVRGGPLTDPLLQFFVLPSVGEVVWGGVDLFVVSEDTTEFCRNSGGGLYVVDFDAGRFTPVLGDAESSALPQGSGGGTHLLTPVVVGCPSGTILP